MALLSGGNGLLIALGGVLIAVLAAFLKGRISGAKIERNANRAKEADAYEKHLKDIATAADARNSVQPAPDGGVPDKYRRD